MADDVAVDAADFFVLRAASIPLQRFIAWGSEVEAPGLPPGSLRNEALDRDASLLRTRLREECTTPAFREALFVASPTLEASLDHWVRQPEGRDGRKTERALVRYFARATGRAIPFGLFAGCAVGAVGDQTRLVLKPHAEGSRRTRLDVGYVEQLRVAFEQDRDVRSRLRFFPNSSIYRGGDRLRWVEVRAIGDKQSHHLVSAPVSRFVEVALAKAENGARQDELLAAVSDIGVEFAAAQRYIDELIDSQLLVSELQLRVTGEEPLDALVEGLREVGGLDRWPHLEKVPATLAELDRCGGTADEYRSIASTLDRLPAGPDVAQTFQVDSRRSAVRVTVSREILNEFARAAGLLERITPPTDPLRGFRESFVERFEQRLVPLTEALDADLGVGITGVRRRQSAEPLLRGLPFPGGPEVKAEWGTREQFLLERIQQVTAAGKEELVLNDDDLRQLEVDQMAPLSDGFAVFARLAADSDAALDAGDFDICIASVGGPCGAELLGRFASADPELADEIRTHLRSVDRLDPESIAAEITHIPEGRHGNVICRPVLRDWEIPYLNRSAVGPERQIPVQDLLVGVRGDEVVLLSRRLGRRVVPRLSCAHNHREFGTPLYRFLCAAQTAREAAWGWRWGPLADTPFLPRVRVGRFVLSLRAWRLDKEAISALTTGSLAEKFDAAQELRATRRLPRIVLLAEQDRLLPVDLDNVLCVDAFESALHDRDHAQLVELWPGPERLVARDDQGGLVSELVVPFRRRSAAMTPKSSVSSADIGLAQPDSVIRHFAPGGEWLYLKLYTPETVADRALAEVARAALETRAATRWFFIRYGDPDHHLRLRFRGDPGMLRDQVLPAVQATAARLLQTGVVSRIVIDTYEREIERYGGGVGIEISEALFDADSTAVLELLGHLEPGDAGSDERWQIALIGASMFLDDLRLRGTDAIELLARVRAEYGAEFRVDAPLTKALGERARSHRGLLSAATGFGSPPAEFQPGTRILHERSAALAPIVDRLYAAETTGQLARTIPELAQSYLHMHLNRILRREQRAQELVIYDFLLRAHRSGEARR